MQKAVNAAVETGARKQKPDGAYLLSLLIDLYADQCGVKIAYEIADEAQGAEKEETEE